jgi:hypothetical protein
MASLKERTQLRFVLNVYIARPYAGQVVFVPFLQQDPSEQAGGADH